jgi:hypothetical protein
VTFTTNSDHLRKQLSQLSSLAFWSKISPPSSVDPRVEAGKNTSTVIPVVSGETVPVDLREG